MGAGPNMAVVLHPQRDPGAVLDKIGAWAISHGSRVLMRAQDAARWAGESTVSSDAELAERADAVVALGGDGTMLGALWLGSEEAVAFNDLAFVRVPGDGVVEASLSVGGQRMGRYRSDGLVLSTSIGSTAYAYSAGGPVVSPALDAVVVAPLAPLAGISRPTVTGPDEPLRLTLLESSGRPAIEVDGT